jgi:LPS sulfotransferase NodH
MKRFDYFIVLAGMRTGSNLLEVNLNALDGVSCHGEAFNPSFIGYPQVPDLLGINLETREKDPLLLLERIKHSDTLAGFRFFSDHDPRILETCLQDPRCAKVTLDRNPVESFVSWKIAQATGQWKLTNATESKSQSIDFDADDFDRHLAAVSVFHRHVQRTLQVTGQTAFRLNYDDLRDVDVVNGLAAYLGTSSRLSNINKRLKKQNPAPLSAKVRNFNEMQQALRSRDPFDLDSDATFEPKRGPAIPTYIAAPRAGLMYLPLRSGPDDAVSGWLAAVDDAPVSDVLKKFSQRTLRDWQATQQPHRRFAVVRHPLARAHVAFCDRILAQDAAQLSEIRANLRRVHKLDLPADGTNFSGDDGYDADAHRAAFMGFLKFLKNNLSGQTSIRVDPSWASQHVLLQGMAEHAVPDAVLREDDLAEDLPRLAARVGIESPPVWSPRTHPQDYLLHEIYDLELETAARDAYAQDYRVFGFANFA